MALNRESGDEVVEGTSNLEGGGNRHGLKPGPSENDCGGAIVVSRRDSFIRCRRNCFISSSDMDLGSGVEVLER